MKLSLGTRRWTRVALVQASLGALAFGWTSACADGDPPAASTPPAVDAAVIPPLVEASMDAAPPGCTAHLCAVPVPSDGRTGLYAIWGSGPSDVWAGGSRGTVLHYDGAAWKQVPVATLNTIYSIWGSSASEVWFGSSNRALFRSKGWSDAGAEAGAVLTSAGWPSGPETTAGSGSDEGRVWSLWGQGPGKVVAAGEGMKGFQYLDDAGITYFEYSIDLRVIEGKTDAGAPVWRPLVCRDDTSTGGTKADCYLLDINAVWGSSAADLVVVASAGRLRRVGGLTPGGDGSEVHWSTIETDTKANLTGVWGTATDNFLVVGERGTLLRSDGYSVTAIDLATKQDLHAIWGSGPSDIWVVGEASSVFHYDGVAWRQETVDDRTGTHDLYGVWGTAGGDVWVAGDDVLLKLSRKE